MIQSLLKMAGLMRGNQLSHRFLATAKLFSGWKSLNEAWEIVLQFNYALKCFLCSKSCFFSLKYDYPVGVKLMHGCKGKTACYKLSYCTLIQNLGICGCCNDKWWTLPFLHSIRNGLYWSLMVMNNISHSFSVISRSFLSHILLNFENMNIL